MGVRESAESMEGELNLHNLTTETKSKEWSEVLFDPEESLTEKDWNGMLSYLTFIQSSESDPRSIPTSSSKGESERKIFDNLLRLDVISKKRVAAFLSEETNISLKQVKEKWQKKERYLGLRLDFFLDGSEYRQDFWPIVHGLSDFKKGEKTRQEVMDQLNPSKYRQDDWYGFSQIAMAMRIAGFKKEELGLDDEAWDSMKKLLKTTTADPLLRDQTTKLVFAMKILAAHEVEATDKGLKIEMVPPENFEEKVSDRPERRKF